MECIRVELLVIIQTLYSVVDLIVITESRTIHLHFISSEGYLSLRLSQIKASEDLVSICASSQVKEVEVSLNIVHDKRFKGVELLVTELSVVREAIERTLSVILKEPDML